MAVAKPTIVVVEDDDATRERLARELRCRYQADYTIIVESSPPLGLATLDRLVASGDEVAVVLAAESMSEMSGIDFLTTARDTHPRARRGLLIAPRIRSAARAFARAWTLGQFDYFLPKPEATPDEQFHRAVTEFLDEWWRVRGRGVEMFRVVAEEHSARGHQIRDLFDRSDYPYRFYTTDSSEGQALLAGVGHQGERRPVVLLRDGRAFIDPSNSDVGEAFGAMVRPGPGIYDLAIVGGGPSGLAAAVYAGSEGLRTALIEPDALGGQAGTSSLIRNYLGFPRGITGAELASRAVAQASLFATEIVYGNRAVGLRTDGTYRAVHIANGTEAVARAVIIATGVSYRRLGVPSLESLLGAGVFYGAGSSEAQALTGEHVFVVGGGNSAGQAALHLARYASQVTILVRSHSLADTMSDYLITEITNAANIEIRYGVEVVGGGGHGHLEQLELRHRRSSETSFVSARALFVLIGAEPFTDWLPEAVLRDKWGYIVTGTDLPSASWPKERPPLPLETSVPGVFAVGDVRSGSVKRVASSVGDGSICIRLLHQYLSLPA
jgi:thioredoxin reductase (NADPH)